MIAISQFADALLDLAEAKAALRESAANGDAHFFADARQRDVDECYRRVESAFNRAIQPIREDIRGVSMGNEMAMHMLARGGIWP